MNERPRILVIGSANTDFVMRALRLPDLGETVTDCEYFQTFGGKGANQAVAAARAGGDVSLLAGLGDDPYAAIMLENFTRDRIDVGQVVLFDGCASGAALVMVDASGNNYLTVAPGSNHRLTSHHVRAAKAQIARCEWLMLQMEIPADANLTALDCAAEYNRPVLFNFAPAHDVGFPRDGRITGLIVNETEASALLGAPFNEADTGEMETAAAGLREAGHKFVIITLGARGAVFADETQTGSQVAFPVEAVDATAAGDTFCGALAVALGEGQMLKDAIRFASASAALTASMAGAQPSIPHRVTTLDFLRGR